MTTLPSLARRADTGAVIIKRTCHGCGSAWPAFGSGVHYKAALKAAEAKLPYVHLLGTWWCSGIERCAHV